MNDLKKQLLWTWVRLPPSPPERKKIMLNRLRDEVSHVCGELVRGDHRAAWWVVLAADAVGVLLLTNLL